jgi:hypothetical protein
MASYTSFRWGGNCRGPLEHLQQCSQYVTPDSKIYLRKSQNVPVYLRKLVFSHQLVQLAVARKSRNKVVHLHKLDLTAAQYF